MNTVNLTGRLKQSPHQGASPISTVRGEPRIPTPAPLVLDGTVRGTRPAPPAPPATKPRPPLHRAFKVRLDRDTAERLRDFMEEFNGVSVAHVIALAAALTMENAAGLDYRYQLAREVRAAAKEDRFGMFWNRYETKKYMEQLEGWCTVEALPRLQKWATKHEVCIGAIVRQTVLDAMNLDTDCDGCYFDKTAKKASRGFDPNDYAEEAAE